jgi:hypothetical protein
MSLFGVILQLTKGKQIQLPVEVAQNECTEQTNGTRYNK